MSFYSKFAEHYDEVFPLDVEAVRFVRSALPPRSRRVVDIGCGTGALAAALARRPGLDVTGIDLDPEMIAAARVRHPGIEFRAMDAREIGDLEGPFDAACSLGNSLAHLPRRDLSRFITDLARLLVVSGRWIFQTVNWDFILSRGGHRFPDVTTARGALFEREYVEVGPSAVRFATRLSVRGRTVFRGEVRLYPVPAEEYVRLHEERGFALERHVGGFGGAAFSPDLESSSVFVFTREVNR
jgi:SAM-dependent methyltransferase